MPLGEDAELQLRDFLFCWQMTIAAHYYTSRGAYSGYFQDHSCRVYPLPPSPPTKECQLFKSVYYKISPTDTHCEKYIKIIDKMQLLKTNFLCVTYIYNL